MPGSSFSVRRAGFYVLRSEFDVRMHCTPNAARARRTKNDARSTYVLACYS